MMPPSRTPIEPVRGWLYPLSNLVRRTRVYMNKRRDIVLVGIALLAQTLFDFLVLVGTGRWDMPWQQVFAVAAVTAFVLVAFIAAIRRLYRDIENMDTQAEAHRQESSSTREHNLIDAINRAASERDQKLLDTLNSLNQTLQIMQGQNRAVIAALGQLEPEGRDEEY
jgi:DNA integrity scanning protein DisA with diadenylate cyclase activity